MGMDQTYIEEQTESKGPVECLGMTFENDEARREHFLEKLAEKLKDPEFRKIEGFPLGEDEDILALSDPPYYTACPNPWIADFVEEWEGQKPKPDSDEPYHREPFAADVSEGKTDPIYKAHSYHTKVPHKAIMRYILHYTEPGDIVFDGFCGTGMTGVAAQMCGDKAVVESLGVTKQSPEQKYKVKANGTILERQVDENEKNVWVPFSKLGARRTVINDLSPAATFIAYNYNTPVDAYAFECEAKRILIEVEDECGWMYETKHSDGRTARISYTVWSEVFFCPECAGDIVFLKEALDNESKKVRESFPCPHCDASLCKKKLERVDASRFDNTLNGIVKTTQREPVLIIYRVDDHEFEKVPDAFDLEILKKIEDIVFPSDFPVDRMMHAPDEIESWGDKWRAGTAYFTHVHHLFLSRAAQAVAKIWQKIDAVSCERTKTMLKFWMDQSIPGLTVLNRYQPIMHGRPGGSQVNRQMSGVYYVPSQISECSPWYNLCGKLKRLSNAFAANKVANGFSLSTGSTTSLPAQPNTVDYIFIDPPFGDNLAYAELNFIVEAFYGVFTNMSSEAIVSKHQRKGISEYHELMRQCFVAFHRVLKPGHWMTVEFSNTRAAVWNSIQTALTEAGFIVANVSALDKKQGSFNAVTNTTSVKQDLIISAYKPNGGFEERFQKEAQSEEGVWDFVRTHLKYLPVTKKQGRDFVPVPERDPRILYDQVVSYYVRKGYPVPISSQEFQLGLRERFAERDEMFFLSDQVAEYDKTLMTAKRKNIQLELFVQDEATAIQWLRQQLSTKPQRLQDINPLFMQEISGWQKFEKPLELSEMLGQNFLCYDGKDEVPGPIHSYLSTNFKELRNLDKDNPDLQDKARGRWYVPDPNKASDLYMLREKALLKEFWEYLPQGYQPATKKDDNIYIPGLEPKAPAILKSKKIKVIRLEAVRVGFKHCWQRQDYRTIIAVAQRIPEKVLQEDPKLLMWYDQAITRTEG